MLVKMAHDHDPAKFIWEIVTVALTIEYNESLFTRSRNCQNVTVNTVVPPSL